MKFKWHILLMLLAIFLMIGCSKDDSTSGSKLPYFSAPVQIANVSVVGQNIVAGIIVIDPKGKQVSARFDWGDGNISDYSDLVNSGVAVTASHTYTETGFYNVKAYAKNEDNVESGVWSETVRIQIVDVGEPYAQEIQQNKTEMTVGNELQVKAILEELSGFQVQARVDWDDGVISDWSALTGYSTWHVFTHTYNDAGVYQVKVQARSSESVISVWYNTPDSLNVFNAPPANDFVLIPSGTFVRGSVTPPALVNEAPLDTIEVEAFYMTQYEISQVEWLDIMGSNPSVFFQTNHELYAPVENIDWYDCIEYCNKRSVDEGLAPCYSYVDTTGTDFGTNVTNWPASWNPAFPDTLIGNIVCNFDASGFRLPTEIEWEYAAKAGTENRFSGTDDIAELSNYAWVAGYPYQTHIVGLKDPNGWGLFDMTGNVWEWCWNSYRFYPGNNAYMNVDLRSLKIARGAGWNSTGLSLRNSYRNTLVPSLKTFVHGLRVVKKA